MNKEFTKDMLKDGDRLTLRNGDVYYYGNDYMYNANEIISLDYSYDSNLIHNIGKCENGEPYKEFDIVKVERIQLPKHIQWEILINQRIDMEDYINHFLTYQTIWEREESKPYEVDNFPSIKEQERMVEFKKSFNEELIEVINKEVLK
ncbi:MAG: hypothetical protein RBR93_12695 [Aliarcobacter butzleri]|nr:hypothetical protein [Aliarcobacter butzleri]